MTLKFPRAYAFKDLPAEGQRVFLAVDGSRIFDGRVVAYPGSIGQGEEQMCRVVDVRWQLQRIRVGDSLGVDAPWPVIGLRVAFNADGRRDRAAALVGAATTYVHDTGATAVFWTRKQILQWLLWAHGGGLLTVTAGDLSAKWDEVCLNFVPYGLTLLEAIRQLAADCGESFGVAPQTGTDPSKYVPVVPGGSSAFVIALPETDAMGDAKTAAAANSAVTVEGQSSIEEATDVVEVHTGPAWIETTLKSTGDSPMLVREEPLDQSRLAHLYRVDVTAYADNGLGLALEAGSLPKAWARELWTRILPDGELVVAGSAAEEAGMGTPLRPEQCVWITVDSVRRRLVGGFEISLADGTLGLEQFVQAETGGEAAEQIYAGGSIDPVYLTVCTQVETVDVEREEATELVTDFPAVEMVVRRDIVPAIRYRSDVPYLPGGVGSLVTNPADPDEAEWYRDHRTRLGEFAAALLANRSKRETVVKVRALDLTAAVALGRKLEISPASTGLDADAVIVDVFYDLAGGTDQIVVTATNNLGGML